MLKEVRFIKNHQKKVFSLHRTNFSENSDFAGKSVFTVEKVLMSSKSGQLAGTSRHFLKVFYHEKPLHQVSSQWYSQRVGHSQVG